MGFFKKFGKQLGKDISGGLNLLSSAFIKPKQTFKGITGLVKKKSRTKAAKSLVSTTKAVKRMPLGKKIKKTAISTGIVAVGVVTAGVAGKYLFKTAGGKKIVKGVASSKKVQKAAVLGGTLAVFAPKTTKTVVKSKAARSTLIAGAINPVAGIAVGLEQGTGLIGTAVKSNLPTIKKAGAIAGGAALAGAAGVGAVALIKSKLDSKKESVKPMSSQEVVKTAPQIPKDVREPVGAVKTTEKANPVTTQTGQKISQKVEVNQKVYKVASVDIKHGRRRKKRGRRR